MRKIYTEAWEAELRELAVFAPDGKFQKGVIPASVNMAMMKGSQEAHPDLTKIKSPALSFFTYPNINETSERYRYDEASRQKLKTFHEETFLPQCKVAIERFKKDVIRGKIIEMPDTDHYCFIDKQDEVVREVRAFLLGKVKM